MGNATKIMHYQKYAKFCAHQSAFRDGDYEKNAVEKSIIAIVCLLLETGDFLVYTYTTYNEHTMKQLIIKTKHCGRTKADALAKRRYLVMIA